MTTLQYQASRLSQLYSVYYTPTVGGCRLLTGIGLIELIKDPTTAKSAAENLRDFLNKVDPDCLHSGLREMRVIIDQILADSIIQSVQGAKKILLMNPSGSQPQESERLLDDMLPMSLIPDNTISIIQPLYAYTERY